MIASTPPRKRRAAKSASERGSKAHQKSREQLVGRHGELEALDASIGRIRRMWDLRSVRDWYAARLDLDVVDATLYRTLRAIRLVADADPSVNGVADALRIDASTASRLIERAVAAGCAQRTPSRTDRRRTTVSLTAAGSDRLLVVRDLRVQFLDAITQDWSSAEIATLTQALHRLDDAVMLLRTDAND